MVKKQTNHKRKSGKSSKSNSKKSRSMKKSQRGGTSNSCTLPYSNQTPQYGGIGTSNLHNTNPQASLDLDNKFMGYGGPVPFGSSIVGGGTCGNEGVGTKNPKSETFKQYLTNMDANLSSITGGYSSNNKPSPNSKPNSKPKRRSKQRGSGYTSEVSEYVGGQPVYKAYDDNSPPALINGQLIFGSPDQPVCGSGAVKGGGRRSNKKSKSHKKRKTQKGGSDFTTSHSSKPAEYSSAFNGEPGFFKYPDDMTGRSFEGKQPNYGPNDI